MNNHFIAATILTAILSSGAANASDKETQFEKCYGIAKAGKNDCSSKDGAHSCAGQALKDGSVSDWIYVPKGLCEKLAGGTKG